MSYDHDATSTSNTTTCNTNDSIRDSSRLVFSFLGTGSDLVNPSFIPPFGT